MVQARKALLAAYYVLDEDGALGLSEEQLVGVLTSEAGIGVGRAKAEQLWRILASDTLTSAFGSRSYSASERATDHRSESTRIQQSWERSRIPAVLPPVTGSLSPQPSTTQEGQEGAVGADESSNNPNEEGDLPLPDKATANGSTPPGAHTAAEYAREVRAARAARVQARALSHSAMRGQRVDVHAFLRLADLLHQSLVVDDDGDGESCNGGIGGEDEIFGNGGQDGGFQRRGINRRADQNGGHRSARARSASENSAGSRGYGCANGGDGAQAADALKRESREGSGRSGRVAVRATCGMRFKRWCCGVGRGTRRGAYRVVRARWFVLVAQVRRSSVSIELGSSQAPDRKNSMQLSL